MMDTQVLLGLIAEAEQASASNAFDLEGGEDERRLDITNTTRSENNALIVEYETMRDLIQAVLNALRASVIAIDNLNKAGYPKSPTRAVTGSVLKDLDQQIATLTAWRKRFSKAPITNAGRFIAGKEGPIT